jgi:hypothetical protein
MWILYIGLIIVGIRNVWKGTRGIKGQITIQKSGFLGMYLSRYSSEDQNKLDDSLSKNLGIITVIFGGLFIILGCIGLWFEFIQ